jgi:hypothetical protein
MKYCRTNVARAERIIFLVPFGESFFPLRDVGYYVSTTWLVFRTRFTWHLYQLFVKRKQKVARPYCHLHVFSLASVLMTGLQRR